VQNGPNTLKDTTLLSINNYYYRRGGAEFVFFEQNRLMEETGWQVIPFAMQHPDNLDSQWSEYFIDEIEFGADYSVWEKLIRIPKIIYSFEAQRNLESLINKTKPNICHAHNIYHHISPSIFKILKKHNIPTVLTLHDLKLACPAYKMLTHDGICERCNEGTLLNVVKHKCVKNSAAVSSIAFLETALHRALGSYVNNVNRFIVPSRFYLEKFVEWGFKRDQFVYIPNFLDIDKYKPNFSVGSKFLYFGRLGHEKGLTTLVKAAAIAKVSLVFAGMGPEEKSLQSLANDLNVDIEFLGFLNGDNLYSVIRSSKCVVLPSEWYENAPISLMEAYALGKPVIGANIGGIQELVKDEVTGFGFESGSIKSLANALTYINEKPDSQIEDMGKAGRKWIETEFTANLFRSKLLDLYSELGGMSK